jgi:hypothetical protein
MKWKYIFMANGRREQLFNLKQDPRELSNRADDTPEIRKNLYALAVARCGVRGAQDALEGDELRSFSYRERPRQRIYQFDRSKGVKGFPEEPKDVLTEANRDSSTVSTPVASNPSKSASELRGDLDDLGLGLKPGDPHYRAYVGPPEDYDLIAAMTFNLLTTLGLRQHHSLLDVGCGSLRIGRLLIPYLNRDKYVGIEPNEWLVRQGIRHEMGETLLQIKRPKFYFTDSPANIGRGEDRFRFRRRAVNLQSLWTGPDRAVAFFYCKISRFDGALVATFLPSENDNIEAGWIYPACVSYKPETLRGVAAEAGLRFEILDWRHPRQTWALFAAPEFDTAWFQNKPLTWNTRLERV